MNELSKVLSLIAAASLAAACTQRPDPYDPAKMNLKPAPAKVVPGERHKGAFAAGSSLSMGAKLKPLDPAPVKEIRLDTAHKIIEIAPGVSFSAWTLLPRQCPSTGSGRTDLFRVSLETGDLPRVTNHVRVNRGTEPTRAAFIWNG